MTGERIGVVTCAEHPRTDEEQELTTAALVNAGLIPTSVIWNDPSVQWDDFDLVVVRTTWDYTEHHHKFVEWVTSIERIENPAPILTWNADKRYLLDLEAGGIPVTPSTIVDSPDELVVPDSARFVVKPTVGAGARGVERFDAGDVTAAKAHIAELLGLGREVLVQPYLEMVETEREIGLLYVDGRFTHAIEKQPLLNAKKEDRTAYLMSGLVTLREASDDERRLAAEALHVAMDHCGVTDPLLYARVDLLPSESGPVVVELELAEPCMYFELNPGAADELAAAVARRSAR